MKDPREAAGAAARAERDVVAPAAKSRAAAPGPEHATIESPGLMEFLRKEKLLEGCYTCHIAQHYEGSDRPKLGAFMKWLRQLTFLEVIEDDEVGQPYVRVRTGHLPKDVRLPDRGSESSCPAEPTRRTTVTRAARKRQPRESTVGDRQEGAVKAAAAAKAGLVRRGWQIV